MRLAACIPFVLAGASLSAAHLSQVSWHSQPHSQSTTLVDVLNDDPDYTSLIGLLQRARLIPTLNKLENATLFAPTNDAIKRHSSTNSLWNLALDDSVMLPDNIREKLRQQIFYHLLNYSLPDFPNEPDNVAVHKTLHYPRKPVDPPTKEPPPYPPWMPVPGGTLRGEPQRLRVSAREQALWVGTDSFGKGGTGIIKGRKVAGNGVVLGIDDVLEPPSDLARVVSEESSISYFQNILTPTITKLLNDTPGLTLFLPVNSAWDVLNPYERLYLESEFASDDLARIFEMHAAAEKHVRYSESFDPGLNLTTLDGKKLEIVTADGKTKVSDGDLIQPDIYASNGVLHLVSSLLIPPDALKLTPEKYLLALNCTQFVSFLHSVNLKSLVNDTEAKYTILAPQDDVFSVFGDGELPERGSPELKKLLQYHFIPGKWTPKKLSDGMLLETELKEEGLDSGRQVLRVQVTNGDHKKYTENEKTLRFSGAGVIGEPVEVNNTLIYFISRPLVPPSDPLQTALPSLDLSAFLAAVFSTSQAETLRTTPRTSLLMPRNQAFKRLGELVSAHLLSASPKDDLENVILHHALDSVEYAQSLQNGSQHTFPTLEGSDLKIERLKNGSMFISPSGGWAGMKAEIFPKDLLTQTGVIHELSDILIPRSVELTIGKLMKAAKGSTMATLVNKAGFDWILNGTAPPEDSKWADENLGKSGWTLLCPPDDAFKGYNLIRLYANAEALEAIVMQHLIPSPPRPTDFFVAPEGDALNNNQPISLDDSATYSTLRSSSSAYGDVVFQKRTEEQQYVVGIKGARGTDGQADWARVLSWGRSTTGGGTGGVIQIDRLLAPYQPPWWIEFGLPSAMGVIGVASAEAPAVEETKVSAADSIKSFIAGGFGGIAAVVVGHPFDLTKTRLQTAAPGSYTGAIDVVKKTLARDGVSGLYRGIIPPILGVTPIFAVSFWAYDTSKQLIFALTPNRKSESLSVAELATAGFLSAIPTTLVTAPVERAKVLLQVQGQGGAEQKYKGVADVLKHLYKEGGIKSIFRGTGATLARDGPGSAAYFAAYEVTKKALTPAGASPADLNLSAIIVAGGTAGVAMWALAIPPDVLKSRIQSAPTGTYSGLMDCARKTIARDGVAALWKGFGPAMARAFPANAATFLGVEASRKVLDSLF
ncbi:carnitine/acyl carnitine carrier [Cyathus striatus]|nr:carnitine/acyl carnitine carrier [Cyathus striatus]